MYIDGVFCKAAKNVVSLKKLHTKNSDYAITISSLKIRGAKSGSASEIIDRIKLRGKSTVYHMKFNFIRTHLMLIFAIALILILGACSDKESYQKKPILSPSTSSGANAPKMDFSFIETPKRVDIKVSEEAQKALIDLYGGTTYYDKRLFKYFKNATGYVTPVFERKFSEGGKEKLLVVGVITTSEERIDSCHACVPVIGGAIFIKQGSKWVVESEQKIIGWGGPYGSEGDISVVQIGKNKYGVSIRDTDMSQGYESLGIRLLVPYNGKLVEALQDGFSESPSEGACDPNPLPQSFDVKFVPVNNAEYFDIVTRAKFNEGNCEHYVRQNKVKRYRFHNGTYEPI